MFVKFTINLSKNCLTAKKNSKVKKKKKKTLNISNYMLVKFTINFWVKEIFNFYCILLKKLYTVYFFKLKNKRRLFSSVIGFSYSLPYLKLKGSLKKCVVSCRILLVNFDDCVKILLMTLQKQRDYDSKASQKCYSDVTKHKNKPFFCCKNPWLCHVTEKLQQHNG